MAERHHAIRLLRAAAFAAAGGGLMYLGLRGLGAAALIFAVFGELWPPTRNRWAAHAMNWLLPAFAFVFCALRAAARDWWGVVFGALLLGLAIVNAVYVEPSPKRTRAFRLLAAAFAVVTMLAVWRFFADGWMRR